MRPLITLYGALFENKANEDNLFDRKSHSPEYEEFYESILIIIQKIVQEKLTIKQKKILLLFLDNKRIIDISKILRVNHSTIHQNFNLITKNISLALINDPEFLKLLKKVPTYLRENMFSWITDVQKRYRLNATYKCPICKEKFNDKYKMRSHILSRNDKSHINYYRKQIEFIDSMLDKHGFAVKWIYDNDKYLLFSISWIWNYWRNKNERSTKKNFLAVFIQRIRKSTKKEM